MCPLALLSRARSWVEWIWSSYAYYTSHGWSSVWLIEWFIEVMIKSVLYNHNPVCQHWVRKGTANMWPPPGRHILAFYGSQMQVECILWLEQSSLQNWQRPTEGWANHRIEQPMLLLIQVKQNWRVHKIKSKIIRRSWRWSTDDGLLRHVKWCFWPSSPVEQCYVALKNTLAYCKNLMLLWIIILLF